MGFRVYGLGVNWLQASGERGSQFQLRAILGGRCASNSTQGVRE